MADIIAVKTVKGKVLKQRFSESAWKLLGKEKSGWTETTPQTIDNVIKAQKNNGKVEQVIANTITPEPKKEDVTAPVAVETANDEAKKAEFMKSLEGISKTNLKDFLDSQEPPVEYSNKAGIQELKEIFAAHLKYNIEELQKNFA
jgi:hypothetical protein